MKSVDPLVDTLRRQEQSNLRVLELSKALNALNADQVVANDYDFAPSFSIRVTHPAKDADVTIAVSKEFIRPLVEAELFKEQACFDRVTKKLEAARAALQSEAA